MDLKTPLFRAIAAARFQFGCAEDIASIGLDVD